MPLAQSQAPRLRGKGLVSQWDTKSQRPLEPLMPLSGPGFLITDLSPIDK